MIEVLFVFMAMLVAYIVGHHGGFSMGLKESLDHMEYFMHGSSDFNTSLEEIGTIAPYEETR